MLTFFRSSVEHWSKDLKLREYASERVIAHSFVSYLGRSYYNTIFSRLGRWSEKYSSV